MVGSVHARACGERPFHRAAYVSESGRFLRNASRRVRGRQGQGRAQGSGITRTARPWIEAEWRKFWGYPCARERSDEPFPLPGAAAPSKSYPGGGRSVTSDHSAHPSAPGEGSSSPSRSARIFDQGNFCLVRLGESVTISTSQRSLVTVKKLVIIYFTTQAPICRVYLH